MRKNKAAVALARLAAGVPKTYSEEEIKRRTERLKLARAKRWVKPLKASTLKAHKAKTPAKSGHPK